jgi:hypothetical protein
MLGIHAVHFQTYQGLPEPLPVAAPITTGVRFEAPASPATCDSEERPQEVEHATRTAEVAGGGAFGATLTDGGTATDSLSVVKSPSTFDSEERPQDVEHAARATGAIGGRGTADVQGKGFVTATATVLGPDGVAITPGFDSEERPQDVEHDRHATASSIVPPPINTAAATARRGMRTAWAARNARARFFAPPLAA